MKFNKLMKYLKKHRTKQLFEKHEYLIFISDHV
jgi:hypothetical protein